MTGMLVKSTHPIRLLAYADFRDDRPNHDAFVKAGAIKLESYSEAPGLEMVKVWDGCAVAVASSETMSRLTGQMYGLTLDCLQYCDDIQSGQQFTRVCRPVLTFGQQRYWETAWVYMYIGHIPKEAKKIFNIHELAVKTMYSGG